MAKMNEVLYMKEIEDCEYVMEIITERFGDVVSNLFPTSVIYGGAVRDALSGLELLGDLDISVENMVYRDTIKKFTIDPRWIRDSGDIAGSGSGYQLSMDPNKSSISGLTTFKSLGMKSLLTQVLRSNHPSPFYPAHKVDIACCGVAMTIDGRVFETAVGAYDAIKSRTLTLNDNSSELNIDNLKARIIKLEKCGWKNKIDLHKVLKASFKKSKITPQITRPLVDLPVRSFTARNFVAKTAVLGLLKNEGILLHSEGVPLRNMERAGISVEVSSLDIVKLASLLERINDIANKRNEGLYIKSEESSSKSRPIRKLVIYTTRAATADEIMHCVEDFKYKYIESVSPAEPVPVPVEHESFISVGSTSSFNTTTNFTYSYSIN